MTPFKDAVQKLIAKSGIKAELSDALGIDRRTLNYWAKGEHLPTRQVMALIIQMANTRQNLCKKPKGKESQK